MGAENLGLTPIYPQITGAKVEQTKYGVKSYQCQGSISGKNTALSYPQTAEDLWFMQPSPWKNLDST